MTDTERLVPLSSPVLPPRAVPAARIALVRPPSFHILGSLSYFGAVPPIGLAYVAAVLRDAGHQVTVIDAVGEALDSLTHLEGSVRSLYLNGLLPEEIVRRLPEDTQVVGITHMFLHEWPTLRRLVELIRARLPHCAIVLGGENATAFWEEILQQTDAVDYCVLGEGEATMLELVARLMLDLPTDGMAGLASRSQGRGELPVAAVARQEDLSSLPLPAWDMFPMEAYLGHSDTFGVHRGRSMPVLATRGCPFQCTFCSSLAMWSTRYVTREPREVLDEIRLYVDRYHIRNVDFCDLTAIIHREWIIEFCTLLRASGLQITWQLPVGTRSEALDDDVLALLYETGCRNITYAPESGSLAVLKAMKKKIHLGRLTTSMARAVRQGLIVRLSVIIGHPSETRRDVWESVKFLVRAAALGCHDATVLIFAPYPGSEDYRKLQDSGAMARPVDDYYIALARSGRSTNTYNPHMGCGELLFLQFALLIAFYSVSYLRHPVRLLQIVQALVTGNERTHVEQLVRTRMRQVREALGNWLGWGRKGPAREEPTPSRTSTRR